MPREDQRILETCKAIDESLAGFALATIDLPLLRGEWVPKDRRHNEDRRFAIMSLLSAACSLVDSAEMAEIALEEIEGYAELVACQWGIDGSAS